MHKVKSVTPLPEYKVKLIFLDKLEKPIDMRPFITEGISQALLDDEFFQQKAIEIGGGIFWPNGYDFCPEYLYEDIPDIQMETAEPNAH